MKLHAIEGCKAAALAALAFMMIAFAGACTARSNPSTAPTTPPVSGTTSPSTPTTSGPPPVVPPPPAGEYLPLLQVNGHLAVSLQADMTFLSGGRNLSFPTQLFVPPVPITRNGASFSGRLEESGPGEDVTDLVNGTVSPDGATLLSLVYSRQVLRSAGTGTFYQVTLQNLPLASATLGAYSGNGPGLQTYVTGIAYEDGPLNGTQIMPTTTYVSTDWAGASGQKPALTLTFSN